MRRLAARWLLLVCVLHLLAGTGTSGFASGQDARAATAALGTAPQGPTSTDGAPLGTLRVDGETRVLGGRQAFDEVVVTNGGVISVTQFAGGFGEGALELVARRIQVDAGSRITADAIGFRGIKEGKGEGPGGGEGGETSFRVSSANSSIPDLASATGPWSTVLTRLTTPLWPLHATGSGAGGGYGGKGGDGIYLVNRGEWKGGSPYGVADGEDVQLGSAGGAAPRSHHETEFIKGGNGGGILVLRADEAVIGGVVSANGAIGEKGEFDATGGGSGGTVLIHAPVLRLAGKVEAKGGLGGQAVDVGGSGGGGRIKVFTRDSSHLDPSRLDVAPGSGPCPGDIASPRACPGTIFVGRLPEAPIYLPYAARGSCLVAPPLALALVIDTSDSMAKRAREGVGGNRLGAALAAAQAIIDRLDERDRAGIVLFNDSAEVAVPLTTDRARLQAALAAARTRAGSRLDRGIAAGGALLGGATVGDARQLVLLTDGLPDGVTDSEVAAAAGAVRGAGIQLSVLGYASGAEDAASAALLSQLVSAPSDLLFTPSSEQLGAWWQSAVAARCRR